MTREHADNYAHFLGRELRRLFDESELSIKNKYVKCSIEWYGINARTYNDNDNYDCGLRTNGFSVIRIDPDSLPDWFNLDVFTKKVSEAFNA